MFNNEFKKIEKYMDLFLLHQKKTIRYLENSQLHNKKNTFNTNMKGGNIIGDNVQQMQKSIDQIDINKHEKLLEESFQLLEKVTFLMEFIISQLDDDKLVKINDDINDLKSDLHNLKNKLGN